jgi:hypothetical protein
MSHLSQTAYMLRSVLRVPGEGGRADIRAHRLCALVRLLLGAIEGKGKGQTKALRPVIDFPTIRVFISRVPS